MSKYTSFLFGITTLLAFALLTASASDAATSINKNPACKERKFAEKHAVATLFFGPNIRNIIATSNEYQEKDSFPFAGEATDLHFDVYHANGVEAGACLGSIQVKVDANSNERVEFAVEDFIAPVAGEGVGLLVRRGTLDVRKKFDIYLDIMDGQIRRIVWNKFAGLPNSSREMSPMRFVAGQHLLINYSGADPEGAEALIQVFKNDGTFVGVAREKVGPHSVMVTDSVRTLLYKDLLGNVINPSMLPADGEGYIKILGMGDPESERATLNLYKAAIPNSTEGRKFKHSDLMAATITWSRRNADLGALPLGK